MKAAAIVAFILAAALVVVAFFVLATSAKADSTCYFVDLEKISEESVENTRESLHAQGWSVRVWGEYRGSARGGRGAEGRGGCATDGDTRTHGVRRGSRSVGCGVDWRSCGRRLTL